MRCFFGITFFVFLCCFLSEAYPQSSLSPLLRAADSCAYFRNYQASDSIYHQALSLADSLEDRSGYQVVLNRLVNLYTRRQMYEKAFQYLQDFRERSRNKDDRSYVLLGIPIDTSFCGYQCLSAIIEALRTEWKV